MEYELSINMVPMILNEGVRAREVESCMLCGARGAREYTSLRDRRFNAPGTWNFMTCSGCGLGWSTPQPIEDDIGKLYTTEFWRSSEPPAALPGLRRRLWESILAAEFGYSRLTGLASRVLGRALGSISPLRDRTGMGISYLSRDSKNRLLDVGCSSGVFLARMRDLGWDVTGIEPDPIAADRARERGLPVITGNLKDASFPSRSFDAVTVNHVIEHVLDPIGLLRESWRVLAPGGRLIIITPNIESLANRIWGSSWYHLDPPRHLFLFSCRTLHACAKQAGLSIDVLRTSSRLAWQTWAASHLIQKTGKGPPASIPGKGSALGSIFFQFLEESACLMKFNAGEELLLIARRN
jgi:2-polyprenyl-3-methyl-5-hydroxy-6-metoxy-1,4-benzoquinol methylase